MQFAFRIELLPTRYPKIIIIIINYFLHVNFKENDTLNTSLLFIYYLIYI